MNVTAQTTRRAALGSLLALSVALAVPSASHADHEKSKAERIGLGGYCPVCILDAKKWVKGKPEIHATYDGVTYYFPGEGPRNKFLANAAKYVPALGGDCIVCYATAGKRVPGNVRHGVFHGGRLFLFPGENEKKMFLDNPKRFADTDLALNGDCSVCLAHANKRVPGKAEFTVIHNGFRYQFPSDRERQMFLKNPAKYADNKRQTNAGAGKAATSPKGLVAVSGKTSCAGCEHGVAPIGAPDELGLSVTGSDGQVYVIEDAHKRWPTVYKNRYSGQNVEFKGRVIQRRGRINWVEPTELKVL